MGEDTRKRMTVSGTVEFYGLKDNYNGDGKEYTLCIKDPKFNNIDWDQVDEWYKDEKGKIKLPGLYKDLKEGKKIERAYFKSAQYPITKVSVYNKEDKNVTQVEVNNPQLAGLTCLMALKKQFIGAVMLDQIPEEFVPSAFADIEDLGDDLPFN